MPQSDLSLRFVKDSDELRRLCEILISLPAFALDIETTDWWNQHRERIALLQVAFRQSGRIRVAIIDALAELDFQLLRSPLEQSSAVKIIHNAAFDASRLNKHYGFNLAPVFDTMAAARRSGERKYSLKAQAEIHLGIRLDKSIRASDWSRRPLSALQLNYAALDPYATLLLYENQTARGLSGEYRLKLPVSSAQKPLPLGDAASAQIEMIDAADVGVAGTINIAPQGIESSAKIHLTDEAAAMLGVITKLPTRYSPDGMAASVGSQRVGLAGWIIDRRLGENAEMDEETVKLSIADLCEKKLVGITESRRLEATDEGARLWRSLE